jgi:DNA-binding SARP family transcriptional activator
MAGALKSNNKGSGGVAPEIDVKLFGAFELHLNGEQDFSIRYDKVRALLAYLVLMPHIEHRRIALASMLWPDVPDDKALGSLRQCLTQLRQTLGESARAKPLLQVTRNTLCFAPSDGFYSDVTALSSATADRPACGEWLQNRRYPPEHYSRPLLDGLHMAGCDAFDAWLERKRERYHSGALAELHQGIRCAEAVGASDKALEYCWLVLALEPWDEQANAAIIRLQASQGQRSAALRHFESYRQGLHKELGAEPDRAINALYQQLRENEC